MHEVITTNFRVAKRRAVEIMRSLPNGSVEEMRIREINATGVVDEHLRKKWVYNGRRWNGPAQPAARNKPIACRQLYLVMLEYDNALFPLVHGIYYSRYHAMQLRDRVNELFNPRVWKMQGIDVDADDMDEQ